MKYLIKSLVVFDNTLFELVDKDGHTYKIGREYRIDKDEFQAFLKKVSTK